MKKCERCGKKFDPEEEESYVFDGGSIFDYDNFNIWLCGECANQAIDNEETGIYFETCEECGREFDYFEDSSRFDSYNDDTYLSDWWDEKILCCDCALKKADED